MSKKVDSGHKSTSSHSIGQPLGDENQQKECRRREEAHDRWRRTIPQPCSIRERYASSVDSRRKSECASGFAVLTRACCKGYFPGPVPTRHQFSGPSPSESNEPGNEREITDDCKLPNYAQGEIRSRANLTEAEHEVDQVEYRNPNEHARHHGDEQWKKSDFQRAGPPEGEQSDPGRAHILPIAVSLGACGRRGIVSHSSHTASANTAIRHGVPRCSLQPTAAHSYLAHCRPRLRLTPPT